MQWGSSVILTHLYDAVHREEEHTEGNVPQQRAAHATVHPRSTAQVILHGVADRRRRRVGVLDAPGLPGGETEGLWRVRGAPTW